MKKLILTILGVCSVTILVAQQMGTFLDTRDGKTYKTIEINNQVWMAENLAFKVDEGCRAYDDNSDLLKTFGYLYSWKVSMEVCPSGWRLPTLEEYKGLIKTAGDKKKVTYQNVIPSGSTNFSALLGGYYDPILKFKKNGEYGYFWTSKKMLLDKAFCFFVDGRRKSSYLFSINYRHYHSVRCLKGE